VVDERREYAAALTMNPARLQCACSVPFYVCRPMPSGLRRLAPRPRDDSQVVDECKVCSGADKEASKGCAGSRVCAPVHLVTQIVQAVCADH